MLATSFVTSHTSTAFTFYMRCIIPFSARQRHSAWDIRSEMREATPYGQTPKYLIRDHDSKFGPCFARVAATSGIRILKTPSHAPRANAICERFLGSVRRECLDHVLILSGSSFPERMFNGARTGTPENNFIYPGTSFFTWERQAFEERVAGFSHV